jgi:hypothetical protein
VCSLVVLGLLVWCWRRLGCLEVGVGSTVRGACVVSGFLVVGRGGGWCVGAVVVARSVGVVARGWAGGAMGGS